MLQGLIAMIVIMIIFKSSSAQKAARKSEAQKVDIKRLVMTGKEHEVPRALIFFISSMCQSTSSFFRQEIEIGGVICGVIVAVKCQRRVVSEDCSV